MSELCALGKWSPHFFHTSQTRPFHMVLGKRVERGHRAEKAAGFFPRSDLGTQGFTYIYRGQETQSQQDHQSYHHSIRVRPQQIGYTVKHNENGLRGSCPSLGDWPLSTDWGPMIIKWYGRRLKAGVPGKAGNERIERGSQGPSEWIALVPGPVTSQDRH